MFFVALLGAEICFVPFPELRRGILADFWGHLYPLPKLKIDQTLSESKTEFF